MSKTKTYYHAEIVRLAEDENDPYDPIAHAIARAEVHRLCGPRADRRLRRLQKAADAGFDTWEEYRGER